MTFCTVVNCMDGRVQLPVTAYLKKRFNVEYVDTITAAGPNLILAELTNLPVRESILRRVRLSIELHHSTGLAVVGHHDCAGNPASETQQKEHVQKAVQELRQQFGATDIIGLWVDDQWTVHEVAADSAGEKQ